MGIWKDLLGTTSAFFRIGLSGVRLKNGSGNLLVRNAGDSADAEITASKANISGNDLVLNSDAAGSGADYKITLSRPASGMTADVALTLPVDDGTAGQVLATDGSGALSWVSAASTGLADKIDTTSLAYNSSGTVSMFTTGAGDVVEYIDVVVDTAFDGSGPTPVVSVGISGSVSKYAASTQIDLTTTGQYRIHPGLGAQGAEALIATFTAGGSASAGAARILVHYATPA